jgi:hypothetical protein
MERETELFLEMGQQIERLKDSVTRKNWAAGLSIAQDLERFASRVEQIDTARDWAFFSLCVSLGLPRETFFSALLPRMNAEQRGLLEKGWRNLRMSVVRLATATNRMRYFAEALSGTLGRMLEEVFPHRRGKIYSRRGTATRVNDAFLVDRKL